MKIAITGAAGFFGRHLHVRLTAAGSYDITPIDRSEFGDKTRLADRLRGADVVVHLAGVNRGHPGAVESQNAVLAEQLVQALDLAHRTPPIVFANSVHTGADTPYGRGKQRASELLETWATRRGTAYVNLVFQNLFGEGGKPDYNSFVATFCDRLASGRRPEIQTDRALELIHAQRAAHILIDVISRPPPLRTETILTHGVATTVSDVLRRLNEIAEVYGRGVFPELGDSFTRQLFNTYRSFLFPGRYPVYLTQRADDRGMFVESVRSLGGESQASYSTTLPGVTRGNHFHLEKVERFLVLKGRARIAVRPVCGRQVTVFDVSGDRPSYVDIPTLHAHNISNSGDEDLYTLFWSGDIFDPAEPDTFAQPVE